MIKEDLLKMAKKLDDLLWSIPCNYHDASSDKVAEAQNRIGEIVKKIGEINND